LTLYFTEKETLSHLEGDTRTVARENLPESEGNDTNVVVPLNDKKTGLFQSLLNSIGLGEDEQEIKKAEPEAADSETTPTEEPESPTEEVK